MRATASSGSNFRIAFRFLPKARRRGIEAVYAFCRLADDAVDQARDRVEGRASLDGARSILDDAYARRGASPVAHELSGAIGRFGLPRRPFDDLLEGMSWDLEGRRYADRTELTAYCERVASTVGLLCVRIFGCASGACDDFARELGVAPQWTNIPRDVGSDLRRGRIYLPATSLREHGLAADDLGRADGTTRGRLTALIREEGRFARARFDAAERALPRRERNRMLAGLIMAAVYRSLLTRIERAGAAVLDRKVALPAARRALIAGRVLAGAPVRRLASEPA